MPGGAGAGAAAAITGVKRGSKGLPSHANLRRLALKEKQMGEKRAQLVKESNDRRKAHSLMQKFDTNNDRKLDRTEFRVLLQRNWF